MKLRLLALLTSTAVAAGGASAEADDYHASGYLGVNLGASFSNFHSQCCTAGGLRAAGTNLVFGGEGRANVWLSNDMSVQLDAQAEGVPQQGQRYHDPDGRIDGIFGAHLSWRDPNSYLLGFFGGLAAASNNDYDGSMTLGILGVEGQYYLGPWTFYAQGGYEPLLTNSDTYEPKGIGFGRFVTRYYFGDNDRLQGEFAYGSSNIKKRTGNYDIYTWGASWEHRYDGTPFSMALEYDGFDIYRTNSPNPTGSSSWAREHIVKVDFKIHFGDGSLEDQDRQGATLDMPNFDRAAGWAWYTGQP